MPLYPYSQVSGAADMRDADSDEKIPLGADSQETAGLDGSAFRVSPQAFRHMPLRARGAAPEAGNAFGPYLLVRLLGTGGFGQVWEAESLDSRRRVALKILTEVAADDPEALRRFEREAQVAASLSHSSCVYTFGAQQIEGYPTIAMELMPGGTLQDRLDKQGRISVREAVDFTLQVIDGLEAAREAGIVHRDVKPSNCFLDAEGHAKVGDFGISKSLQSEVNLTMAGSFVGTPSYASPEQVRGRELDFRSDIYSVGALLYALLTGKPPFMGSHAGEVLAKIVAEEPAPFPDRQVEVPRALQRAVLRRALAKDREKRYQDYASLRQALLPFSSRGLTTATLARRLGAICLDLPMFQPISMWLSLRVPHQGVNGRGSMALILAVGVTLRFLYFVTMETVWGRSLGKFAFGLRVTTSAGSAMTFTQACLRTGIFVGLLMAPDWQFSVFPSPNAESFMLMLSYRRASMLLACLALVITMRRSNGYAGLHEILSHTRVRAARELVPVVRVESQPPDSRRTTSMPEQQLPQRFGPYRVVECVWETGTEALFVAYDDILRRKIWVHRFREVSQAPAVASIAVVVPGRLHWLQGSRAIDDVWDAYEATTGASFSSWVKARDRLRWHEVRAILSGVLAEIGARIKDKAADGPLSLDYIWVHAYGQAKILDFPAVAAGPGTDNLVNRQTRKGNSRSNRRHLPRSEIKSIASYARRRACNALRAFSRGIRAEGFCRHVCVPGHRQTADMPKTPCLMRHPPVPIALHQR
jgi:eukaryotic-like serine/threonine-protein kinase